jgi:hypothetical protein
MPLVNPNVAKQISVATGRVGAVATMVGGITNNKLLSKAGFALGAVSLGAGIASRLGNAGLLPGGAAAPLLPGSGAGAGVPVGGGTSNGVSQANDDWRVRIGVGPASGIFYKSGTAGILAPLISTNGVIFPYTPSITLSYQNNYQPMGVTHSINTVQAYQNSDVSSIAISGEFTAQTEEEADYVLAVIHFFKSASKMYFGSADNANNVGAPPPILFLNGFGQHYFPNVTVILQSFTHTMADDVDFVYTSNRTRIPTRSNIQLALVPQYSRKKVSEFNLDAFARGDLINKGFL